MQDDLATMTRENQDVNVEVEELMKIRDEMKIMIEDRDNKTLNLEKSLASRVSLHLAIEHLDHLYLLRIVRCRTC